jgi:hypothetical protein
VAIEDFPYSFAPQPIIDPITGLPVLNATGGVLLDPRTQVALPMADMNGNSVDQIKGTALGQSVQFRSTQLAVLVKFGSVYVQAPSIELFDLVQTASDAVTLASGAQTASQAAQTAAQAAQTAAQAAAAAAAQAADNVGGGSTGSAPTALNDASSTSTTAPLTAAATKAAIQTKIDTLVGGAPAALDSFYEIASQLSSDESAVAVLNTSLAGKVGKTGTETITGAKTFSSPVTVAAPTAPTHAATMAYVDAAVANAGGGSGGSSGIAYDTDGVPYVASTGAGTGMAVDTDGSYYIS